MSERDKAAAARAKRTRNKQERWASEMRGDGWLVIPRESVIDTAVDVTRFEARTRWKLPTPAAGQPVISAPHPSGGTS